MGAPQLPPIRPYNEFEPSFRARARDAARRQRLELYGWAFLTWAVGVGCGVLVRVVMP